MSSIGILALQGDFYRHAERVREIGAQPQQVRRAEELDACDGLIIPGGESTAMVRLGRSKELWRALMLFGQTKPIFGTCAGLILLSTKVRGGNVDTLGLIDLEVERNAYGRQVHSFATEVSLTFDPEPPFHAIFIRAPKIFSVGDAVRPLAGVEDDVVLARSGNILVASFHPELTSDLRIHRYFLDEFVGKPQGMRRPKSSHVVASFSAAGA